MLTDIASASSSHRGDRYGIARADHPMVPAMDNVFYFEVKIENAGRDTRYVIPE